MTEKAAIDVWVIWTFEGNELKFYGAVESEEKARAEVATVNALLPGTFHYAAVMLIGWAFNKETGRVYSNDDPNPRSSGGMQ